MVTTGLEVLLSRIDDYQGRNAGVIVNMSSVTSRLEYSWEALMRAGLSIKRLFSPEHGLFGTEQDQVAVNEQSTWGLPVSSLYGDSFNSLSPDGGALEGLDLIIFDIQDIGTRYYTYINTLVLVMKKLHGSDIELVVLDRPNPLNGITREGPLPGPDFYSFVGLLPVPVRHGLTAGECALLAKETLKLDIFLKVIPMQGWQRDLYFDETGLPWVPPSPNMPTLATALVYPGLCLLEGMNISEGRGTTTPFELIGAPFIDPRVLGERLNALKLSGVIFRPTHFRPVFNKFAGELCGGVFIHVTDRRSFNSSQTGLALIQALFDLYEETEFIRGVYEFNSTHPAFDLLTGSASIREMIEGRVPFEDIRVFGEKDHAEFMDNARPFLLYGGDR